MKCMEAQIAMSEMLEGADRPDVREHAADCGSCAEAWADLQAQHRALEEIGASLRDRAVALETRIRDAMKPRSRAWTPWLLMPVAAAMGVVVGAWLFGGSEPPGHGIARLQAATGIVQVSTDGTWEPLATGTPVPDGASVRTVGDARAMLALEDGSDVLLRGGTECAVEGPRQVRLATGMIWSHVEPGEPFEISWSGARAVALGTELAVERLPDEAQVWVEDGRVRVEAGGAQRLVEAGQSCRVAGGVGDPEPARQLALATSWVLEVQAIAGADREDLQRRIRRLLAELGDLKLELPPEDILALGGGCAPSIAAYLDTEESRRDAERRRMGAWILSQIAGMDVAGELVRLLEDADGEIRAAAAAGLERLAGGPPPIGPTDWVSEPQAASVDYWRGWAAEHGP